MPDQPEHAGLARGAARRLSASFGPNLEAQVERALVLDASEGVPTRFEPVTLGVASLMVSVAALAWTIYRDLKGDRERAREVAARDAIARRIRQQVELPAGVSPEQRDRIIDAVLDEINRQ